jgi:hypothetical protein
VAFLKAALSHTVLVLSPSHFTCGFSHPLVRFVGFIAGFLPLLPE